MDTIPDGTRTDIEVLLRILDPNDELRYYERPVSDRPEDMDWCEVGIAIVRKSNIIAVIPQYQQHDCNVY